MVETAEMAESRKASLARMKLIGLLNLTTFSISLYPYVYVCMRSANTAGYMLVGWGCQSFLARFFVPYISTSGLLQWSAIIHCSHQMFSQPFLFCFLPHFHVILPVRIPWPKKVPRYLVSGPCHQVIDTHTTLTQPFSIY